ncbi:unnamed protein product [Meganyctiphanes norvegica]|uniref:Uncharacterized protein n=1 Tax=Meganyctiphanes norvegica TaxID=48144 RepID=A0AAV2PLR3_MEGNR
MVALVVAGLQVTDASITCYECSDDSRNPYDHYYDIHCGAYDYHGHTVTSDDKNSCYLMIYDSGYTSRDVAISTSNEDGECVYPNVVSDHTSCYCWGSYCNTHSYCEQCAYPKPTPTTTEPTTLLSTSNHTTASVVPV